MGYNYELKSLVYEGFPRLSVEAYPDARPQLLRVNKIRTAVYSTLHQIGSGYETSEEMVNRIINTCGERLTENSLLVIRQYFGFLALENLLRITEEEHVHTLFDKTLERLYENLLHKCKNSGMSEFETACSYFVCAHTLVIKRIENMHWITSLFAREFDPYISYYPFIHFASSYVRCFKYSDTTKEEIINAWLEWRREHVKYSIFSITKNTCSESICLHHQSVSILQRKRTS